MSKVELFRELSLSEARLAAVEALGWAEPTPIQWKAIPPALEGKDIVGVAQTGTGKTGAFMIPSLERIKAGEGLQVLVLCPTRELAQQVAEDTHDLGQGHLAPGGLHRWWGGLWAPGGCPEPGCGDHRGHAGALHRPHGETAGGSLGPSATLILDEADRMLDMGFRPQIEDVRRGIRGKPQVMLFSATMPNGVHALALQLTDDPVWLEADSLRDHG